MYGYLATGAVCFCLGIGFANMPFLNSYGPHTHEAVACTDLDNYVEQTNGISDFQYHFSIFGIHRKRTIDAVNELYERAHCEPHPTEIPGRMAYKMIDSDVVADQMPDPQGNLAPRSVPAPAAFSASSDTAPAPSQPVIGANTRHRGFHIHLSATTACNWLTQRQTATWLRKTRPARRPVLRPLATGTPSPFANKAPAQRDRLPRGRLPIDVSSALPTGA